VAGDELVIGRRGAGAPGCVELLADCDVTRPGRDDAACGRACRDTERESGPDESAEKRALLAPLHHAGMFVRPI